MNKLLWTITLFVGITLFSCGDDDDYTEIPPIGIKPDSIYGRETAEEIFRKYGCRPHDPATIFVIGSLIDEVHSYRYLIGGQEKEGEDRFWLSQFSSSGDYLWEIAPFDMTTTYAPEIFPNGDLLIMKNTAEQWRDSRQTVPVIVNKANGQVTYVDVKSDFIYNTVSCFDPFFFLSIDQDGLQQNAHASPWFYQVDYTGKVLSQKSWMNIPDPDPLWLNNSEFITANSYQIARKGIGGKKGEDRWKYELMLPAHLDFTPSIYLERDSVIVDYHLTLPDGSTDLYQVKLSAETGEPADKGGTEPPAENVYEKIGVPALAPNGLTVTMNSIDISKNDAGTIYYNIHYTVQNLTTDLIELEGTFQMMYNTVTEGETQYGFFDKLYPGESTSRSYTFRSLENEPFQFVYYQHNFLGNATELVKTALKWKIELPF